MISKNTARVAAATAALCAAALAGCSSGGAIPGVPGAVGAATGSGDQPAPSMQAPGTTTAAPSPTSAATQGGSSPAIEPTPAAPASPSSPAAPSPEQPVAPKPPKPVIDYKGPAKPIDWPDNTREVVHLTGVTVTDAQKKQKDKHGALQPQVYGALTSNDEWHFVKSEVPFNAAVATPEKKVLSQYTFNRVDLDPQCTAPGAEKPRNGHFVRVFVYMTTDWQKKGTPAQDVTENTFGYRDKDGTIFRGQIVTPEAKACMNAPVGQKAWGTKIDPGTRDEVELMFDVPSTDGELVHHWRAGVGGWAFPVTSANPTYKSTYERTGYTVKMIDDADKVGEAVDEYAESLGDN